MKNLIVAVLLLTTFMSSAFGQGAALGTISGRITDPSEAPIAGVTVTAVNSNTHARYSAATSSDGFYIIRFVQPGPYSVEAIHPGFQKALQPAALVTAASNPTVNFRLTLGSVNESVTVTDKVGLVQLENADRGGELDPIRVEYATQIGRVAMGILIAAPGVNLDNGERGHSPSGNSNASGFMINGGQDRTNEMLLDGVVNRTSSGGYNYGVIPTFEETSEVRVITNAYSAEYGNTTGGVINVTTKSGTNSYHGELFSYVRNTALNANYFERNLAGQPRAVLKYMTYGGVSTGRIWKDKLFYAVRIHKNRSVSPKPLLGHVPTSLERSGDFSQTYYNKSGVPTPITIYDPWTTAYNSSTGIYSRQPFANALIPSNRINAVPKSLWQYVPQPNITCSSQLPCSNYANDPSSKSTVNFLDWTPRIDWNISDKSKFMARYIRTNDLEWGVQFYPNSPADIGSANGFPFFRSNHNMVIDYTRTISPTSVLDVRLGYERYNTGVTNTPRLLKTPGQLGFSSTFVSEAFPAVPVFTFGGSQFGGVTFSGIGLADGNFTPDQVSNFDVNWSKVSGRHILKVGGQIRLERLFNIALGNNAGAFSFGTGDTNGPNRDVSTGAAGNEVASFLLGVGGGSIDKNSTIARQLLWQALFVQDDIKVTPKFTLSVGLRWDHENPMTDRFNALTGIFDTTVASPLASAVKSAAGASYCPACANLSGGLTFPAVNGQARTVYDSTLRNFGPRVAGAYAINSKTALRVGYGLFYGPTYYDPGQAGFSQATPWNAYDTNGLPIATLDNPFPNGLLAAVGAKNGLSTNIGSSISFIDPHAREPESRQFSFELQREIPWGIRLSAAYVNNTVTRLPVTRSLNALTEQQEVQGAAVLNQKVSNPFAGLAPGQSLNNATIAVSSLIVPYPQFTSVSKLDTPVGRTRYDALQIYVVKRLSHGISFSVAYAASKNLAQTSYQWPTDTKLVKYLATLDMPQTLVPNFSVELPFGRGHLLASNLPGWADRIVNGWMANGIIRVQKGIPVVLSSNAISNGSDPNAVPGGQNLNQWINPAAFTPNTNPYAIPRWPIILNSLRCPPIHRFEVGVTKKVRINDRFKYEFSANAYNAMNTPEFWNCPTGTAVNPTSASFGKIAGVSGITNAARILELGSRLTF